MVVQRIPLVLGGTVCVSSPPRSAVAGGNLVPGNGELSPDILRLCAKERRTCHRYSPEPCVFSRSAGWELAWEAHGAVRCSPISMLGG